MAQAVLTGELRECAWEALKALYFHGSTDQACVDRMVRWAKEHGIQLSAEKRQRGDIVTNVVLFRAAEQRVD